MKDIKDVEIEEGDTIAYAYSAGTSAHLDTATVVGFTEHFVKIVHDHIPPNSWRKPTIHNKQPTKILVIKKKENND